MTGEVGERTTETATFREESVAGEFSTQVHMSGQREVWRKDQQEHIKARKGHEA